MPPGWDPDPDEVDEMMAEASEDAHVEREVQLYGTIGSEVAHDKIEMIDPKTGITVTKELVTTQCSCGRGAIDTDDIWRCTNPYCLMRICPKCQIRWSRQSYCKHCAESMWQLDKQVFFALWFISKDIRDPEDFIRTELQDDVPVEITVDRAATILHERDYLAEGGGLSPQGQEALSVGEKIYEEDDDVQSLENKWKIRKVANNG